MLKVTDQVRVNNPELWCHGFIGEVITIDIGTGVLRYGVRPDRQCCSAAILWFREGELEKQ